MPSCAVSSLSLSPSRCRPSWIHPAPSRPRSQVVGAVSAFQYKANLPGDAALWLGAMIREVQGPTVGMLVFHWRGYLREVIVSSHPICFTSHSIATCVAGGGGICCQSVSVILPCRPLCVVSVLRTSYRHYQLLYVTVPTAAWMPCQGRSMQSATARMPLRI